MVYEANDEGWSWGQLVNDGYVGWLPTEALRAPGTAPTHKVTALRTLVFPGPSIKLPPVEALSFGCRLAHRAHRGAVRGDGGTMDSCRSPSRRRWRSGDGLRRGRRALCRHALSLGRQDQPRPRLLRAGAGRADRLRHRLPARQRHAGTGARLAGRARRRFLQSRARRPAVLAGSRRHRARRSNAHPRQRLSHGGRDRADRGSRRRASARPAARLSSVRRIEGTRFSSRGRRSTTCSSGMPTSNRSICRRMFGDDRARRRLRGVVRRDRHLRMRPQRADVTAAARSGTRRASRPPACRRRARR